MDDREMVEATLRGKREAFAQLVRKYQAPLVASACHLIYNRDDAEDLAQESFVEAYKQLHTLRERDKFAGWLFTILRSKCLRYLQRRQHDVPLEALDETLTTPPPVDDSALADALQRLPLQDREVLAARYLHGLDYDEVATSLGISIDTARKRCSRARERLRHLMQEADEERTRLLMQRAMGIMLIGGLSDTFTSRVLQEVSKMHVTQIPHAAAHGGIGQSSWPQWIANLTGWKIITGIVTLLVIAGTGVTLNALRKQSDVPGGVLSSLAMLTKDNLAQSSEIDAADMKQAFSSVKTIHITGKGQLGLTGGDLPQPVPSTIQVETWVRRDPYATYEERTGGKGGGRQIIANNTERRYCYFPKRGNKAYIFNGLKANFTTTDDPESAYENWFAPYRFKTLGFEEIEGKRVILLEVLWPEEYNEKIELAVDPDTKLACRVRLLRNDPNGKPVAVTDLRIEFNQTPPAGIFDWQPPADAIVVDKRSR